MPTIIVHTRLSEEEHEALVCTVARPDEDTLSEVLRRLVREAIARAAPASVSVGRPGSSSPQEGRSPSP